VRSDFENSAFGLDVRSRYESEGGVWAIGGRTPWLVGFWYCVGLDIPLTLELFQDMETYTVLHNAAYDETPNGKEKNYCWNHIGALPAYKILLDIINDIKNGNDDAPKIFVVGSHGFSIRRYLWGLNIYDDRILSDNAELTTLEIYSAKSNIDGIEYYFRWTRRGEFVPYPACNDIYQSENTQLCDLEIMLNQDFVDAVSIDEFNKNICPNAIDLCLCDLC